MGNALEVRNGTAIDGKECSRVIPSSSGEAAKAEEIGHRQCLAADQQAQHRFPVSATDLDMDDMYTAHAASIYGVNMAEYGSMMALMTEHDQPDQSEVIVPSSFSSYHGHAESLLSAAMLQACQGGSKQQLVGHNFSVEQLMPHHEAVISDSALSPVKTEVICSNLGGQFKFHRKAGETSMLVSPLVSSLASPHQEAKMVTSLEVDSPCSNINPNDQNDAMKTKIAAHPYFPRLVAAYMDCQKIGAPPEVVALLDEISRENQRRKHSITISIGADPELDQFMEAYCEVLSKYQMDLTKPYKEAKAFLNKIETQLNILSKGMIRNLPSAYSDERDDGDGSSEEDFSGGEMETHAVDPRAEDRELKDQLLRKYSGYLSTLKQEFLKKKKKGKLPKEARQKLLDWWNLHYKWPYPSETDKVALAETTGLDQKQINNWFINQRKRHWKPSADMQFVVMDSLNSHSSSFFMDGTDG